jgi:hypothetical protein
MASKKLTIAHCSYDQIFCDWQYQLIDLIHDVFDCVSAIGVLVNDSIISTARALQVTALIKL